MHRHTADEIFYCVQGECTFTLEAGGREKLKPGMVVFIPKNDYYKLENTGAEYLILLGMRSEPSKLARFSPEGETTGSNTWALENRSIIAAKKREITAKRAKANAQEKSNKTVETRRLAKKRPVRHSTRA
jgi:oxalate decarboxylase/phosphoglucose isomerase-like protein (cupin superfamily)